VDTQAFVVRSHGNARGRAYLCNFGEHFEEGCGRNLTGTSAEKSSQIRRHKSVTTRLEISSMPMQCVHRSMRCVQHDAVCNAVCAQYDAVCAQYDAVCAQYDAVCTVRCGVCNAVCAQYDAVCAMRCVHSSVRCVHRPPAARQACCWSTHHLVGEAKPPQDGGSLHFHKHSLPSSKFEKEEPKKKVIHFRTILEKPDLKPSADLWRPHKGCSIPAEGTRYLQSHFSIYSALATAKHSKNIYTAAVAGSFASRPRR
jgi:hypothetical protein